MPLRSVVTIAKFCRHLKMFTTLLIHRTSLTYQSICW